MIVSKNSLKVFGLFIALFIVLINGVGIGNFTFVELLLFGIIGLLSVCGLIAEIEKRSFSLNIMHWLFIFFFMFIAPVLQIGNDYSPWGIKQSSDEIELSCIMVILWCGFYCLGNYASNKIKIVGAPKVIRHNDVEKENNTTQIFFFVMTALTLICGLYIVSNVGLANLFSRSTSSLDIEGANSKTLTLLVSRVTRCTIVYTVAILIDECKKTRRHLALLVLNFIILLITSFPTGLSRNVAAVVWLGIMTLLFSQTLKDIKHGSLYVFIFAFSLIIIFPAINVFRRSDFWSADFVGALQQTVGEISGDFLSGDYDAFSLIADTRRYVTSSGISWGNQLLGALLFFVPRSIWKSKSVGTGQMIFESFNMSFTNISCPLIAEGYVNFGMMGVVIFAMIAGCVCNKIDDRLWNNQNNSRFLKLLYPFLLPSFFFMMRGDMMTTWAYMFAYISVFWGFEKIRQTLFAKNTTIAGQEETY